MEQVVKVVNQGLTEQGSAQGPDSAQEQLPKQETSPVPAQGQGQPSSPQQQPSTEEVLRQLEVHNVQDEEEPQPLFKIQGVCVMPRQSVALVAGQRKNGKSNFAALLMGTCVAQNRQLFDGAVQCLEQGDMKVLYIDTEQPRRDTRRTLRRMMRTAGYDIAEAWDDHGVKVLSLKDIELTDRQGAVQAAVDIYRPALLIIDGLADLLRTINDENEARTLWQWLDQVACTYDCAVLGMLHQNHQSSKVGGWAGTQGVKKATDLFEVKKNREHNYFSVNHEGRGESAPRLQFFIAAGMGDNIGVWQPMTDPLEVLTKEDMQRQELLTLLEDAPLPCNNRQLVRYIMDTRRYTSKSPADKLLRKAREMHLLDSRREGRNSVWFRTTSEEAETDELFDPDDEADDDLL